MQWGKQCKRERISSGHRIWIPLYSPCKQAGCMYVHTCTIIAMWKRKRMGHNQFCLQNYYCPFFSRTLVDKETVAWKSASMEYNQKNELSFFIYCQFTLVNVYIGSFFCVYSFDTVISGLNLIFSLAPQFSHLFSCSFRCEF